MLGITSVGDSEKDLKRAFEFLEKYNCNLVVACCHKKKDNGGQKNLLSIKRLDTKRR